MDILKTVVKLLKIGCVFLICIVFAISLKVLVVYGSQFEFKWGENGVQLARCGQNQQAISDGSGGAIIVWEDLVFENTSYYFSNVQRYNSYIRVQRINSAGIPMWESGGVTICGAKDSSGFIFHSQPKIVSDGSGGAIIVWEDCRNTGGVSGSPSDIYAQRIDSSGKTMWTSNGVPIKTYSPFAHVLYLKVINDGCGGAIIAWNETKRNYETNEESICIQRVNSFGEKLWGEDVRISKVFAKGVFFRDLISDEAGGAILVWEGVENTALGLDLYVQRINSSGTPLWTDGGIKVNSAPGCQGCSDAVSDGAGGVIIAFMDCRYDGQGDVYVQRVNSAGKLLWGTTNMGVPICVLPGVQYPEYIASDGEGGAIISCFSRTSPHPVLYIQRINLFGKLVWNGLGVTLSGSEWPTARISDNGLGGALVVWKKGTYSNGFRADKEFFIQNINSSGKKLYTGDGICVSSHKNVSDICLVGNDEGDKFIIWDDFIWHAPNDFESLLNAQKLEFKLSRIRGINRYQTSVELSRSNWTSSNYVVIATGENFPDALSGTPLAKAYDCPLLLVAKDLLPSETIAEINRLGATEAIILGGEGVISNAIVTSLQSQTSINSVTRIGGENRHDTAQKIALKLKEKLGSQMSSMAVIATANNFPDALAIAGFAGYKNMPILLVEKNTIPDGTLNAISSLGITSSIIVGGTGVISDAVKANLPSPTRLSGENRYQTAKEIAEYAVSNGMRWETTYIATGINFPDALSCGAVCAKNGCIMLLTNPTSLGSSSDTKTILLNNKANITNIRLIGGNGAISDDVGSQISAVIN